MASTPITLSDGATTLSLPRGLLWTDEFQWSAVESSTRRGLTGKPLIHSGARQYGRPITLAPPDEFTGVMTRTTLAQLQPWADTPDLTLTLTLRGTEYAVRFDHAASAIDGRALTHPDHPDAGQLVSATLRFLTVEPV